MPTGFDARAYAKMLMDASPEDRAVIKARFSDWIMAGARAQGMWNWFGALLPIGAFGAILLYVRGLNLWPLYVLCAIAFIAGGWCMRIAQRRERAWRTAHPFATWKG
jgi:hypothetical protein